MPEVTPEEFEEHLKSCSNLGSSDSPENIADKAKEIIYGDRESTYGDPSKNLRLIASLWSSYAGTAITEHDVCNMMALLKISRLRNTPGHTDSLVDLVGYTLLQERLKKD